MNLEEIKKNNFLSCDPQIEELIEWAETLEKLVQRVAHKPCFYLYKNKHCDCTACVAKRLMEADR